MENKTCNIFLASPSDTEKERKIVMDVVSELKETICKPFGITLELLSWENSVHPGIGSYPQEVINQQIGDDYTLFVGIMWKKFGTPTKKAGSATEEEYNRALESFKSGGTCKNIMFYFNEADISFNDDLTQVQKVKDFKEKISKENGVFYYSFTDKSKFEKDFRKHLTQWIFKTYAQTNNNDEDKRVVFTEVSEQMLVDLDDAGASFTHPNVDEVKLSDIFVAPVLRKIGKTKTDYTATSLSSAIDADGIHYLITGNESAGKSSLAKFFFNQYYQLNLIPVLLNGMDFNSDLRTDKLLNIIQKKIQYQYASVKTPFSDEKDKNSEYLLIIDDFQKSSKGNSNYWHVLTHNLESLVDHIIVLSDEQIGLLDISENPPFKNFTRFELLQFGPKERSQLINNWFGLGMETLEGEEANELLRRTDEAKANVKRILGRNYIPSYPFYILGMLQAMEAVAINNTDYSLYGFYYEKLINDSLNNAIKNSKDTDFYYNFLTEYCFALFAEEGANNPVALSIFETSYNDYCTRYAVDQKKMPFSKLKSVLLEANIIQIGHDVKIVQRYVYYFFVARYISIYISKRDDIKDMVQKLIQRAFRNEYSSILMFVTHLSKDGWIVSELVSHANSIFQSVEPCRMEEDLDVINNLITEIPKQIVGVINVMDEREKQLQYEAEIEAEENKFDNDNLNYQEFGLDDDVSQIDIIAKFNLAMKTIDLLGEVTKKYWGGLLAQEKYNLVLASYQLGLRALHHYIDIMDANKQELVGYIKNQVADRYIKDNMKLWSADDNKLEVKEVSDGLLFQLAFLASWVFVRRVSSAVGYDKLNLTYEEIMKNYQYNSYKLIDLSIDLNYNEIDIDRIEEYKRLMEKNHMSHMLLRELTIHHLYMFDDGYKKRQQVFQIFDVDIKQQRQLGANSVEKRS
jgi:hypothetical protein